MRFGGWQDMPPRLQRPVCCESVLCTLLHGRQGVSRQSAYIAPEVRLVEIAMLHRQIRDGTVRLCECIAERIVQARNQRELFGRHPPEFGKVPFKLALTPWHGSIAGCAGQRCRLQQGKRLLPARLARRRCCDLLPDKAEQDPESCLIFWGSQHFLLHLRPSGSYQTG